MRYFRYQMCELIVTGSGFLWHQIRCIVALLILIGQGKEDVSLIQSLLDIERYPSTPNYQIASGKNNSLIVLFEFVLLELPLCLFDCQFDGIDWIYEQTTLRMTIAHLQRQWTSFEVRATMIRSMIQQLENQITDPTHLPIFGQLSLIDNESNALLPSSNNRKSYQPILRRSVRDSVETKLEKFQNKKGNVNFNNTTD